MVFPKIYERTLHNSLSSFKGKILKSCSFKTYRRMEESLDHKNIIGAVPMDLSKVFECIPHDLLVAKLHAHGLSMDAITFIYSYMKRRKQGVKRNYTESLFKILLSRESQGSILGRTCSKYLLMICSSL